MVKDYQQFKENIIYVIQNSNLNIGAIYFIFKDLFLEIERLYYNQINQELAQEQKENEKQEENE